MRCVGVGGVNDEAQLEACGQGGVAYKDIVLGHNRDKEGGLCTALWDNDHVCSLTYRSEATMKTSLFTLRYLPLPQPMSRPTEPGARSRRNASTTGQGCVVSVHVGHLSRMPKSTYLVASRTKVRRNRFVDRVDMGFFVSQGVVISAVWWSDCHRTFCSRFGQACDTYWGSVGVTRPQSVARFRRPSCRREIFAGRQDDVIGGVRQTRQTRQARSCFDLLS